MKFGNYDCFLLQNTMVFFIARRPYYPIIHPILLTRLITVHSQKIISPFIQQRYLTLRQTNYPITKTGHFFFLTFHQSPQP